MARCAKGQNHAVKYRNAGLVGAIGGSGGSARDTVVVVVVNPRVVAIVGAAVPPLFIAARIGIIRLPPRVETAVATFDGIMLLLMWMRLRVLP